MLVIEIPGRQPLRLTHLVLDYNGTIAIDGGLLPGVGDDLQALAGRLDVHIVTADTFGQVRSELSGVPCKLAVLPPGSQDHAKLNYVRQIGTQRVACVGNGRNDQLMLRQAALGIAVVAGEGAFPATVMSADVVCTDIRTALALLIHPLRLAATLRV